MISNISDINSTRLTLNEYPMCAPSSYRVRSKVASAFPTITSHLWAALPFAAPASIQPMSTRQQNLFDVRKVGHLELINIYNLQELCYVETLELT